MSKHCQLAQRDRVEAAAMELDNADDVDFEAIDVLTPAQSEHDCWTLDAVVVDPTGIPPEVSRELALYGLTLRPAPSRGGNLQSVVATA